MKRDILIASFDMEVGGVERSLISLLENFDYKNNTIDLMLYKHQGDFMSLLPEGATLLNEIPHYATFRKSIKEIVKDKQYIIALARILSKMNAYLKSQEKGIKEQGYLQMQLMWKYSLPFLPKMEKEYDVAISYLWPHYFVAEKVKAKRKIAWIHTDYSNIDIDVNLDMKMWNKFDFIIAVSDECKNSFVRKYSQLEEKVIVIENISSPGFVKKMSEENVPDVMVKDKRFKVVTVARLSHAKGIDNAVRALKIMKEKGINDIAWYVIGYGGDEEKIRRLIVELDLEDCFILLGKKINPYPYMNQANLYVQPSRYEGKAVTVTEAQILSRPVIITNYSTAKSQIKHGFDGYIADLSILGIADAIESLYKNLRYRRMLEENCKSTDYCNNNEMEKLYKLI